ncbi:DNA-binding transcriptional regulator YhcF (GntR family) [Kineosphaera limosa]|uniref:Putative GntR family transcriptional regulator n=1 Tax=Kineosphaera limosa NBRC 100340 TaxID=1184609 RepID=K6WV61_9MICO|nr:GntR family transcriptional regulator [Kineosphaera limosa]NYE02478.1 DNA-binding transcriptional regulator YhcF (GntR family) [Kineosphaera limosa]GAB95997.1 putative GntR family transcriptional regulator [Kineosphaera limosa NBRC 100340]
MIIELDRASGAAPYEQIRDQIVAGIVSGELATGARLPTVRQLAADLGVAVNTVAKAYKQLESEGHVAARSRAGTVVLGAKDGPRADETQAAALLFASAARRGGLDLDQAVGVLRRAWS